MKILKNIMIVFVISLIPSLVTSVIVAQVDAATPPQGPLYGTVQLHGANISPSDIKIRIRPLVPQSDLVKAPGRQPATLIARISAIPREPNALQFVIPDVMFGLPYRLGIQFNNKSTGKVVWRVTNEGMVVLPPLDTTEIMPIRVDGYVVTSEMEILRSKARGNAHLWVGADNLEFGNPDEAVRNFRWRTSLPGASKGRLQISTQPLTVPTSGRPPNPCDTTGLIYTMDFNIQRNGWTALPPINFNSIIMGTRSGEVVFPGVDPKTLLELQMGAGLYLRAVPLDSSGAPICNSEQSGLPGMVVVANLALAALQTAKLEQAPITLNEATYQAPNVSVHPKSDEVCYRTTKDHYLDPKTVDLTYPNFLNYNVYNYYLWKSGKVAPGTTASAGKFFCIYQGSSNDSWFEDFVGSIFDLVTGLVDAAAEMVNFAANLVERVKAAVVDVAAGALSVVGVDCDDTCHKALETGLEVGMVAMGLPPSLPNFDQLMEQGTDYLAEMAAEQVGIPPEVADAVANKGTDFVKKVAEEMKTKQTFPGLPDWLMPDIGLDPAVLTLYLSGPGYDLGTNPSLYRNYDSIFLGSELVMLPRQFGSSPPLRLPMVLQPNLEGLPPPPSCKISFLGKCLLPLSEYDVALWNKQHWVNQRLKNGCTQFYANAFAPAPAGVYKLFSANVQADISPPFPFWDNFSNCSP